MAISYPPRVPAAQQFIRLGFGEVVDPAAPFYSHHFLTQELTTAEAQDVIPVLEQYNSFNGKNVAAAIQKYKGLVSGWKFGALKSPALVVVLAPWSHQIEDKRPGGPAGTKFTDDEMQAVVGELKRTLVDEQGAELFEPYEQNEYQYLAWWS